MKEKEKEDIILFEKRVLLEIIMDNLRTPGGIYIPQSAQKKTKRGKVLRVADNCEHTKEGETVIFDEYSGTPIMWNDKDCLIINEENLMANLINIEGSEKIEKINN